MIIEIMIKLFSNLELRESKKIIIYIIKKNEQVAGATVHFFITIY